MLPMPKPVTDAMAPARAESAKRVSTYRLSVLGCRLSVYDGKAGYGRPITDNRQPFSAPCLVSHFRTVELGLLPLDRFALGAPPLIPLAGDLPGQLAVPEPE